MKKPVFTKQFRKDYKRMKKAGKNLVFLHKVIKDLLKEEKLDNKYCDHSLQGKWKECRDCHIQNDWLLIYKITETSLLLFRTGTHSELFK